MKKKVFIKNPFFTILPIAASNLFTIVVFILVIYGLNKTEAASKAEDLRTLELNIRRAVVTCYAVEGSYPDSISYIEKHYDVHIDTAKYYVHYEIFASNLLPDVTVIPK